MLRSTVVRRPTHPARPRRPPFPIGVRPRPPAGQSIEAWTLDESQQLNLDIEPSGVLAAPPAVVPPPNIYGS